MDWIGFVKHGLDWTGFVKYGLDWTGFVKYGFVKYGPVKRGLDWICKTWICKKICSEKQTKANNLFLSFLYQFSALLSPLIKLFELCIATPPFYSPSLPLSLSRPKYLFTLFVNKYNLLYIMQSFHFGENKVDN